MDQSIAQRVVKIGYCPWLKGGEVPTQKYDKKRNVILGKHEEMMGQSFVEF